MTHPRRSGTHTSTAEKAIGGTNLPTAEASRPTRFADMTMSCRRLGGPLAGYCLSGA